MKVLVACEFTGTVRDAFLAKGHDAYSCDLRPNRHPNHIQADALTIIDQGWDLMICHPPCTYLCSSGIHWNSRRPERVALTQKAIEFALQLANAPIPMICLENPISVLSTEWRRPDQIIQPWQFGHDASKATALWLKNLPKLKATTFVPPRITDMGKMRWANQTDSGQNRDPDSGGREKRRSITYKGIAEAFADQWG